MRHLLPIAAVTLLAVACVDAPGENLQVFPTGIEFADAPGVDNRHTYEISGPTWRAEHRTVADVVWTSQPRPRTDARGVVEPEFSEPAPYVAGTPMRIRATLDAALSSSADLEVEVHVTGTLRSTTNGDLGPIEVLHREDVLERVDGRLETLRMASAPLPNRIDVWELELDWTVSSKLGHERYQTRHVIPTTWRHPIEQAPLYKRIILWSSTWAAGEWPAATEAEVAASEHEITSALLRGTRRLEDEGRSYGGFPRPDRDRIDDRANVWLDFSRSACGEWRGALMALVETQGIDASWVWYKFPDPDDEDDEKYWHPGVYTHYRTRDISAVGRKARRWTNTNHIVVQVNGRIYDPTYTVVKDSWSEYEDWMFTEYCKADVGTPSDSECVPNPAGYDESDDVQPLVIFADNYR